MNLGRIDELLALAENTGLGLTFQRIKEGDSIGGFGPDKRAQTTEWVVGYMTFTGGGEIAAAPELADAVAAAIDDLSD